MFEDIKDIVGEWDLQEGVERANGKELQVAESQIKKGRWCDSHHDMFEDTIGDTQGFHRWV